MNYENTTIPRNDDIAIMTNDVRQTLGLPNTTINNRFGRLCVSDKINMFALKKPVSLPDNAPNRANEDWCKGDGLNYGIKIPAPTTIDKLVDSSWYYERPTGGAKSPFRLYDFVGYRHKCPAPWYSVPSEMYTNKDQQKNVARSCYPMSESGTVGFDKYKVQLEAASGGNKTFYAAILVKDQSNDGGYIRTYETPINGNDQPIDFAFDGLPEKYKQGYLQVTFFITNVMQKDWISATQLPLGMLCWGGYGVINYTTYVTTFVFPPELIAYLDRNYEFIDSAETVYFIIKNTRTDGKGIQLGDDVYPNKIKVSYTVTSASGENFSATDQYLDITSGNQTIYPGETNTIRFDRMMGYTENGQQMFPPDGFTGTCFADIYYGRRNDAPGLESMPLIQIQVPFKASGFGL